MSIYAMTPVWKADLKPGHKLVLLAYADSAKADGSEAWPGWGELQAMTGYSRSRVASITKELCALGVMVQTKRGHRGQRAEYDIDLDHPIIKGSEDDTLSRGSNPTPERVQSEEERVQSEEERVPPVVPLPSSTPVLPSRPTTPVAADAAIIKQPDYQTEMKDAIVAAMGWNRDEVTGNQWGKIEVAGKQLRDIDTDPAEVPRRAMIYRMVHPTWDLTPTALVSHWADVAEDRVTIPEEVLEKAQWRAEYERLLANPKPKSEAQLAAEARQR